MNTTIENKIEFEKQRAAATLEASIKKLQHEDEMRRLAPAYDAPKWATHVDYNETDSIRYEVNTAAELLDLLKAYRVKYSEFLPIGKYKKSCCVVTAHPWGEYVEAEALKASAPDAVMVRNNKGKGFSSVEFTFYPMIEGRRVEVRASLAFRKHINGMEGHIDATYSRNGDPVNVRKTRPSAFSKAAYLVDFGGGSRDSADWRGIFTYDTLATILKGEVQS